MPENLQQSPRRSLSPWAGAGPIGRLRDEMENLLERFSGDGGELWPSGVLAPPMDFSESEFGLQVRMDLPGVDPKEIDIQVSGNQLTVSGERKEEQEEKGETYHRVERRTGRFSRSVTLPCPVDEDKIDASYRDGVLSISVPKREEAKGRRINVKTD